MIDQIQLNKQFCLLLYVAFTISSCKSTRTLTYDKSNSFEKQIAVKYAEKLNTSEQIIRNIKLYSFIDSWYGTPYKFGGLDKSGIDCSGFVSKLYEQIYSMKTPRTTTELNDVATEVKKKDLKEGDLVFFKIDSKKVSHVGVYLMNNKFVHSSSKKGIMISDLNEEYFEKSYYKGGRLK